MVSISVPAIKLGKSYVSNVSKIYGKITGNVKDIISEPIRRTTSSRSTGGGQSGSAAYSDRNPTPKPIGGPLTNIAGFATNFGNRVSTTLGNFSNTLGNIYGETKNLSQEAQEISQKTQEALGNFGNTVIEAPAKVVGGTTAGITEPVGQLSKDILPLAAVIGAALILR